MTRNPDRLLPALCLLLALLLLASSFNGVEAQSAEPPVLRCGLMYPFTANPLNAGENSWKVLGRMYEGATRRHPETGEIIPYIAVGSASHWAGNAVTWSDCMPGDFAPCPGGTWADPAKPEIVIFYDFEGVRFHDGHTMDIRDIMFSLHVNAPAEDPRLGNPVMDRGGMPGSNYSYTDWLFIRKVWESRDSTRAALRFTLQKPYLSVFEDYLSSYILPYHIWGTKVSGQFVDEAMIWCDPGYNRSDMHSWKHWVADRWANSRPVGSGPFIWAGREGDTIRLDTWEGHFYGPGFKYADYEDFAPARPGIGGISFTFYMSEAGAVSDLADNRIDLLAWGLDLSAAAEFANDPEIESKSLSSTEVRRLAFNMRRESFGYAPTALSYEDAGKPLRRALAHAIDYGSIGFLFSMMDGESLDTFSEWQNASAPKYNFDPAESLSILRLAGYRLTDEGRPPGEGNWWLNPDGTPLGRGFGGKIEMLVGEYGQDALSFRMGAIISEQMLRMGVNVGLVALEATVLEQRLYIRDFDMAIIPSGIPGLYRDRPENFLYSSFHSNNIYAGENYFGYGNASFDSTVLAAMASADRGAERLLVADAMSALAYDAPYIDLHYLSNVELFRADNFRDLADDGSGTLMNAISMASARKQDRASLRARFLDMPLTVMSNASIRFRVQVVDRNGDPVAGAEVALGCTMGNLSEDAGATDGNGLLAMEYCAPEVPETPESQAGVFASISINSAAKPGFRDAAESRAVFLIYPEGAVPLLVTASVEQDVIPATTSGGSAYVTYLDVLVTDMNNIPVEGAIVSLNITGAPMMANPQSAETDTDGVARISLKAPDVGKTEECLIAVTASKRSYLNGSRQVSVIIVPRAAEPDGPQPPAQDGGGAGSAMPMVAAVAGAAACLLWLLRRKRRRGG